MSEQRVEQWKRRLLDLSLANRLLNAKDGKRLLPLECDDVAEIENRLAGGGSVPVASPLAPSEQVKRLREIYNAGRTAIEESGANAVFVALGFLEWKEREGAATSHRAPVLLVPATLSRTNATSGYRVAKLDEDTRVNTTLVEFLRAEFGIVPSGLDPLPEDDSGVDVEAVFASLSDAVAPKGWKLVREAALGFFSFGKVAMWKDLSERFDAMRRNPLVAHLAEAGQTTFDDGVAVFSPEEISKHLKPLELFCPLSADASQLTAVLYAAAGKSFVLHGPPGTGKSQTITNLIVHNLALGRRVLFVSEKKAALDVVYRRLRAAGVGPFCLELHSAKAGKAEVLAQFAEAMNVPDTLPPAGHGGTCVTVENTRDELSHYAAALHRVWPNGLSAHDALVRLACAHPASSEKLLADGVGLDEPRAAVERRAALASELASEWSATNADDVRALEPVLLAEWTPAAEKAVSTALGTLTAACREAARGGLVARLKLWWRRRCLRDVLALPKDCAPAEGAQLLNAAAAHLGGLRLVAAYRQARGKAAAAGLAPFASALEAGAFAPAEAVRVLAESHAAKSFAEILSRDGALARFSGLHQEEVIRRFREADALMAETVKREVFARLASRLPPERGGDSPRNSEFGVLKRECAKKMRHKPVRQLLEAIPTIAPKLKPCFLMSPLSVSQYLPPETAPFDLVVFDEASQIPVGDAIGVIARGRQLVVVGDPKQMPPTNFFQKGDAADEEPDPDAVEDMESILDEALAIGMHSAYLNWHYRSRHESLIAFSNARYYASRLNTFPCAANSERLGVRFQFVENGVYDARGRRTNAREAEAVVDWLFREAASGGKPRSCGVVTFSMAQQGLIEDLIEKRRMQDPSCDAFFAESAEDPFFVKNLENVQGDERDVIVFSIGYAPDANGNFAMNFGPLNRQGGERRLNVAVTRAREEVVVFASVHGAQIDLSRTKAVGAAHLREFLEYAESGNGARTAVSPEPEDALAGAVRDWLGTMGYDCDVGVGASNRKVDLAVKRRDGTGYLLGIVGDGRSYRADLTVRDRESGRVGVLQALGWNVFRLWSVDWRLDNERTKKRLLDVLAQLEADPKARVPAPVKVDPGELRRVLKPASRTKAVGA